MFNDRQPFVVHDVTHFPLVAFNETAALPGYASQWEKEMIALMEIGQPFVVVYDQLRTEETHEDRKQRGIWLKHNKARLSRLCKALISIEPDEARRAKVKAKSKMAVKAFGIPHEVVATQYEALNMVDRLIENQSNG